MIRRMFIRTVEHMPGSRSRDQGFFLRVEGTVVFGCEFLVEKMTFFGAYTP